MSPSIEIEIHRDISWISEWDRKGSDDVFNVVTTPTHPQLVVQDRPNGKPVRAIHPSRIREADIDKKVPHFSAFYRATNELQRILKTRALPQEGPDIIYERLCTLSSRFISILTRFGTGTHQGLSDMDFCGITPSELQNLFLTFVTNKFGIAASQATIDMISIVYNPVIRNFKVTLGSRSNVYGATSESDIHGDVLRQHVTMASRLGIQDLPLHPLGLLPDSCNDPILSAPSRIGLLRGDSLNLYVKRHEYGNIRAFRYLVEHNLGGLGPFLQKYSTLPWRIDVAIENESRAPTFSTTIRSIIRRGADRDEVRIVPQISRSDDVMTIRVSSIFAYDGVLSGAYEYLVHDLNGLLSGRNPLA